MKKGKASGSKTYAKGKPPATGYNQDKKTKIESKPKASSDSKNLALFLSREYVSFKVYAHEFSVRLKPLGLSINQIGIGLANYKAKSYTFGLEEDIVSSYKEYLLRKTAWESFRDSFRVEREAATISTEDLKALMATE